MEAVGFGASLLTFVGAAVTVSKSIHEILSAIKDGPETIGFLNNEIFQLKGILQRLLQVYVSTAGLSDRPELEHLVQKCKDDLVGFEARLRQLDVSGADGRRGRLWRKLKICLEEKDLDQIRHVVRWHVHLLTLHLVIVQTRQLPALTDILPTLQQIRQGVTALQVSDTSAAMMQVHSSVMSSRVTELDDTQSDKSQPAGLDATIARLMRFLEKRPCVVESDDSKEMVDDLERLLQFVQDEVVSELRGGGGGKDVSNEVKLFTSLIVSAPSLRINRREPTNSFEATTPHLAIFQERKRKELHTNDAVITVATAKRREKLLFVSEDAPANDLYSRGFCGSLTLKSKTKKKMVTLSVQQSQLLFDRFTSLLPRVIVCNILPNNSPVFNVASNGSVEDLMKLIVENKASLEDHDEDGWSLMHHAVGNLATFKFLIQQGLDIAEIAKAKPGSYTGQTDLLTISCAYRHDIVFPELLLCAGADPTIELEGHPILVHDMTLKTGIKARSVLHRILSISPFARPPTPENNGDPMRGFCQAWAVIPGKELNPEQERKTLDLYISRGYKTESCASVNTTDE
ncbi:hypothetical protein FIE12Z_12486 [Fusarium flagelliforme]|uniref:Azaphilone pigments biosynthesis cluster protein L N-terminal domain-containing protein n=1 Tax=Fusarium flagelliforme TaxID=2675880 RepID=A0A395M637_9HYPO|nr:hypothetical protein FIE12Z_12486 [Fusarium flagelliforme]